MCENYLLSVHEGDILRILGDPDKEKYFSVNINFLELFESDTNLGNALLTDPENSLKNWNESVFNVQNNLIKEIDKKYTIKNNVNCRIYSLPPWPHVCRTIFPGNDDADKFLQVTGTVVRMSARKLLEYQRQYICTKCKYPITVEAQYDKRNIIKQPKKCTNPEGCIGKNIITFGELDPYNCKDYQEIKIQEDLSKMGIGTVPGHMVVTLEEDLVNICKPGENVTITGIVKRRWSEFDKGVKITVDIVLNANHIQVNNSSGLSIAVSEDMRQYFDSFWTKYRHDPLIGRNIILKSICPEIYGRQLVKLAIAIVLASGSPNEESQISTGIDTRSESHLLLVGDPGTGKSQMLRYASKIIPRSILTTGVGSTAAGLTVTAIMENGEWQLEAGALVMADGGICCIDEFNSMREHDRTSIHEAMEQQTISVAKAGMVCKLKTRCSILAACNPKGNIDPAQPLCVNVAMSSPLLSRFDLILLLRDIVGEENDRQLADYLLNKSYDLSGDGVFWGLEKLQAYYAVIKKENPKLTAEAEMILSTYYQLQRKFGGRNKSRTTVRLLESLIRLSQGHAKLIYHGEVEVIDTVFAIILVDAALDHESSLFNLTIDYDSFFDNPGQQYWELLENILGKLNLDYIYHREVEKMGVSVKKSSQITNTDISQRGDGTSPNLGDHRVVSQSAVTSTPKGTQLLFSQRNPRQKQSDLTNSQNNESCDERSNRSQYLFSQRSRTIDQNQFETILNHNNSENSSHASQFSRESTENSSNMTNPQRESKLLFSQRRPTQKVQETSTIIPKNSHEQDCSQWVSQSLLFVKKRVPSTLHHYSSNDSGNMSISTQKFTQNRPQEKNSYQNFSIYQNKNDSFIRNRVAVNLETALRNKPTGWSEKSDTFHANEPKRKNQASSPCVKSHMEELKEGGSEMKKLNLSEIVKSKSYMDFDLDVCLTNIKTNSTKSAASKSETLKEDSESLRKTHEESGFSSQSRSNNSDVIRDSILEEPNMNVTKEATKRNPRSPIKANSPFKSGKRAKKQSNQNEAVNEMDLLNLMPSTNDDFMKYGLGIDWDMQENNEGVMSEQRVEVEENIGSNKKQGRNLSLCGQEEEGIFGKDDDLIKRCFNKSSDMVVDKIRGAKEFLNDDTGRNKENSVVLQELKNDKNMEQASKGRKSYVDFLSKFEFVPRETRETANQADDKGEKESRSIIEDNVQNRNVSTHEVTKGKEIGPIPEDSEDTETDLIISSQNAPKPPKKFKFSNKNVINKLPSFLESSNPDQHKRLHSTKDDNSDGSIGCDSGVKTKNDAKVNFKRMIANIDLDEEMRNFDFGGSIQKPFSKCFSSFGSRLSSRSDDAESDKNCESDTISEASNNFLSTRNFRQPDQPGGTTNKETKIGSKSNIVNLNMDIENFDAGVTDPNKKFGEKHELYDLTQNSKNQYIRNKFSFKKLNIKRMSSSSRSNSDDI